jgi:hypothetical protein
MSHRAAVISFPMPPVVEDFCGKGTLLAVNFL